MSDGIWDKIARSKSPKARRVLRRKLPKWNEGAKKVLLLEGGKSSALGKSFLNEINTLKKGQAIRLTRKNDQGERESGTFEVTSSNPLKEKENFFFHQPGTRRRLPLQVKPMEAGGEVPLEFLCRKNECGLFAVATHSKKRPHNLTVGRVFDYHAFDMLELGVLELKTMHEYGCAGVAAAAGSKPCLIFQGDKFETEPEMRALKSILMDLFRGEVVEQVSLKGLDRVVVVAENSGKVYLRQCVMKFKKSGTKIPRVELQDMGPSATLTVRRHKPPVRELEKEALRSAPVAKKKNTRVDALGETYGRVYLPKQEVDEMALRKMKGLKRERREAAAAKLESSGSAAQEGAPIDTAKTARTKKAKVTQEE